MMAVPTLADFHGAIADRLGSIPNVPEAAGAVYRLASEGQGWRDDEDGAAKALAGLGVVFDTKPIPVYCALLAEGARMVGDWHRFYPAASTVLNWQRQATRARKRRGGDALDGKIREVIAEHPSFTVPMIWAECARQAGACAIDNGPLVSFDAIDDLLTFAPRPGAGTRDINPVAFRRRVQRIRKLIMR